MYELFTSPGLLWGVLRGSFVCALHFRVLVLVFKTKMSFIPSLEFFKRRDIFIGWFLVYMIYEPFYWDLTIKFDLIVSLGSLRGSFSPISLCFVLYEWVTRRSFVYPLLFGVPVVRYDITIVYPQTLVTFTRNTTKIEVCTLNYFVLCRILGSFHRFTPRYKIIGTLRVQVSFFVNFSE